MPVEERTMRRDGAWETNTTLDEIAAWLSEARRVAVLTHSKPDGDAIGSTLALVRALRRAGHEAAAWYAGPLPPWLADVAHEDETFEVKRGRPEHEDWPDGPDAVVVTDTGAWSQLAEVADWLAERAEITTIIDHHLSGNAEVAVRRLVETRAAAACQPIALLCARLLGLEPHQLPTDIAEPCYIGLAMDTGWFRHSNVDPAVMRMAAALLETGIDHSAIYQLIQLRDSSARLRLLERALRTLEFHFDERVAIMSLKTEDFNACKADPTESGGFVDVAGTVGAVRVSVLLTEVQTGGEVLTKVSMRSKEGADAVDVNLVAQSLGGGGHARAAGARIHKPLTEAVPILLEALGGQME